jgi:hypothetical protein
VLVRLPGAELVAKVGSVLDQAFDAGTAGWDLATDGSWNAAEVTGEEPLVNLQDSLVRSRNRRNR